MIWKLLSVESVDYCVGLLLLCDVCCAVVLHYLCGLGAVQLFCASSQEDTAHELESTCLWREQKNNSLSKRTEEQLTFPIDAASFSSIRVSNMYVEIHM